jgi:hypothetical protein
MDEAKVIINLKEGIIELQGPVDFVRHYLDAYQPAITGLQGLPKAIAEEPERAKAEPQKRKAAAGTRRAKRKRVSCAQAIQNELETGFFDQPRSIAEVKQRLSEAGFVFIDSNVRTSLKRLVKSGTLGMTGRGRAVRFHRPE